VIARVSRGGMRDAISLLELCAGANTKIDDALVFATVGSGNRESALKIIEAVGKSDYDSVYSVINDIVMKSGDLSVFWQEIIDAYRDIMIVKNSERAKVYLDLTDAEYASITKIASEFSVSRLSYHTSMMESAMADMQRALNSKRAIAEITLTRMCDSKLSFDIEALSLRVEELEKTVKMMKLGVPMATQEIASSEAKTPKTAVKTEQKQETSTQSIKTPKKSLSLYTDWGAVLKKIAELKRSLSVGFAGASVYTDGEGSFVIRMGGFFLDKLKSSPTDMAIVRGVIAEQEGKNPEEIFVTVENKDNKSDDNSSDIEKLFC